MASGEATHARGWDWGGGGQGEAITRRREQVTRCWWHLGNPAAGIVGFRLDGLCRGPHCALSRENCLRLSCLHLSCLRLSCFHIPLREASLGAGQPRPLLRLALAPHAHPPLRWPTPRAHSRRALSQPPRRRRPRLVRRLRRLLAARGSREGRTRGHGSCRCQRRWRRHRRCPRSGGG
jgi:hypothetical protein